MKLLFVTVSCLLLFLVMSYAQQTNPPQDTAVRDSFLQQVQWMQSPEGQESLKMSNKENLRARLYGYPANFIHGALDEPEIRAELGISEEQIRQFEGRRKEISDPNKNPELLKVLLEMREIQPTLPNADGETKRRYSDLLEVQRSFGDPNNCIAIAFEDTLTPEQLKKAKEIQVAASLEMSSLTPYAFDLLDLTDAQKQQMIHIKKELETKIMEQLDDVINTHVIFITKIHSEFAEQGYAGIWGTREAHSILTGIHDKLLADNPEYQKALDTMTAQQKQFVMQFKTRMLDALTDEQWERLQRLVDHPPKHVRMYLDKLWKARKEAEKDNVWAPGPNSWKPGDGVPEEYRQERNKRVGRGFPRAEN